MIVCSVIRAIGVTCPRLQNAHRSSSKQKEVKENEKKSIKIEAS